MDWYQIWYHFLIGRREKIVEAWAKKPNPEADVESVEAILRHYFKDAFTKAEGGSHQLRVSHPTLYGHPHFVGGTLSVPVRGGQGVKGFYLKRIAEAISILEEARRVQETNDEDEK
jgi:hypothetical protein